MTFNTYYSYLLKELGPLLKRPTAAILFVGGDKSGGSEKRFYRQLIKEADARFDRHLAFLRTEGSKKGAK